VGDGGAVENGYQFLAHDKEKVWGTHSSHRSAGRNSTNGQYGIPKQIRLQKIKMRLEKFMRMVSGTRIGLHGTGKMMIAFNVGHANIESIDLIKPGHDYGWPIREGSFLINPYGDLKRIYSLPANDSIYKVTYPVAEYDHDEGQGISGGYEYLGTIPH
jgi:hypothetical protein